MLNAAIITVFILGLPCCFGLNTPLTKPNGDLDIASLTSHILKLEETMSELKSESQTQEQKYSAIVTSVLSELKTNTNELNKVKTDFKTLRTEHQTTKDELAAVKAELKSTQDQLKMATDAVSSNGTSGDSNSTSCIHDLESIKKALNVSRTDYVYIRSEITGLKSEALSSQANITTLKSELINIQTNVNDIESSFKTNLTFVLSEVDGLKAEFNSTQAQLKGTVQPSSSNHSQSAVQTNGKDVAFQMTQDWRHSDWKTLMFDRTLYNTGNGYNRTSGMFTAPVSGTYIFWANVVFHQTDAYLYIYQGSKMLARARTLAVPATGAHDGVASTVTVTHLDIGDQVHFTAEPQTTTNIVQGGSLASYGGALLHAT